MLVVATAAGSSASATSDDSSQPARQGNGSSGAHSAASTWICDEGREPRVVTPDVVAPSLPFRGIVYADMERNSESEAYRLVIRFHDTVRRANTRIVVEGLHESQPLSIEEAPTGLVIDGSFRVSDTCSPRPDASGSEVDASTMYSRRTAFVTVPWGKTARLVGHSSASSESDREAHIGTAALTVSHGLGSAHFALGTHANGIHIEAGDQVGAYVLTRYGEESPATTKLYGDSRSFNPNDDAFLLGTDGEPRPSLGAPRLVDEGVLFGRGGRTSALIPWGSAPELVAAERLTRPARAPRERGLTLARVAAESDSVVPCASLPLHVGDVTVRARLTHADYGHRWHRPELLELSVGDAHGAYLLGAPREGFAVPNEVRSECDEQRFLGEFEHQSGIHEYLPRLIGSDGAVLMISWVGFPGDSFYGTPHKLITYVISLRTGKVLECGIEPFGTDVLFVPTTAETLPSLRPRLPPSGWLDPTPCTHGERDIRPEDCTSIPLGRGDDFVCARELDFRNVIDSRPGIGPTPAGFEVRAAKAAP